MFLRSLMYVLYIVNALNIEHQYFGSNVSFLFSLGELRTESETRVHLGSRS